MKLEICQHMCYLAMLNKVEKKTDRQTILKLTRTPTHIRMLKVPIEAMYLI